MKPIRLSVNVDHVATLREARKEKFPDPSVAAIISEHFGASGITCHIRIDRRHIKEEDVLKLKKAIKGELNMEICLDMIDFALKVKPDWITLVPEKENEITTEGGLDVINNFERVKEAIKRIKSKKIKVSIFVEPDKNQIEKCFEAGADAVELNTNSYAISKGKKREKELQRLKEGAKFASEKGLIVKAGHALNRQNLYGILEIEEIEEVSIGFSLISDALIFGLPKAVSEYVRILERR
ncbi:MAG: pyridoxine 5'-phosphate synthase [candidate division WOR-3 bacterium]